MQKRKVNVMEKISNNIIRMIKILRRNQNKIMTMAEIAKELKVKPRVISNYKRTIVKLGYDLRSYNGYNGGYQLKEEYLSLTELSEVQNQLSTELFEKIKRINERI